MTLLINIVGWASALLVLLAYGMLTLGRLRSTSAPYQVMNLLGSAGLVLNSFWNHAFPSVGLNVVWMAISVFAICKILTGRRRGIG